ncbi:DNA polymerase III subunit beta [candidate division KSB1 bacterium]
MDISVACSDLKKGLQQVINVIPSKTTVPVLGHVLFEATSNQLMLSATDLEVSLKTSLTVTVNREGSVTIPGRLLFDVVRELPDVPLDITVEEGNRIQVKSPRGKYTFFGEDAKDFPQLPTIDVKHEITFKKDVLKRHIEKTIFAVSMDELRTALMGVLFQVKANEFMSVSTDGHRLIRIVNKDFSAPEGIEDVIVPLKALNLLLKNIDDEGELKISFANNYIAFDLDNAAINATLIDAKYPDYEKVIPTDNENKLVVKREEFTSALRTISVLANKITQQIRLSIEPGKMTLVSQDMDRGEGEEKLDVDYAGSAIEVGFNSGYLIDILRHIDTDDVEFVFGGSTSAALAFPVEQRENEDILMLVMPIKLRD